MIDRRSFLFGSIAAAGGAWGLPGRLANAARSPKDSPVNLVMIVVDDLGYADLSCANMAKDVETPNIDRLARRGVRFTNAYATSCICNPSRISLMTGRYQQRQGQYWYSGPGLCNPKFDTIAEVLKRTGYATGFVGKFHHGPSDSPENRGFPLNHGFDFLYGFAGGTKHYLRHRKEYVKGKDWLHQGPMWVGREQRDVEGLTTELFGQEARAFIRKNASKKFYLHLSFNAVHNFTHQLPDDYLGSKGLEGFADLDPDKEEYWQWRKRIGYPAHPEGRDYYLGQLYFLDKEIGRLTDELQKQGLKDSTVIFFVSDNGGSLVTYANNTPLKGGKYTLFEGGTRVPMIASFPARFRSNVVVDSVVSTMDLLPTICSLAGTPTPRDLDGIDMTGLLSGHKDLPKGRCLFWDTGAEQAVRKGRWKLLMTNRTPNERLQIVKTPKGRFLFDLETDPGEKEDVSGEHPEIVKELSILLRKWQQEMIADQKNGQRS